MQKLLVANWKMYKTREQAESWARSMIQALPPQGLSGRSVLVFPPATAIAAVAQVFSGHPSLSVGGQNFYPGTEGAFTGEISVEMLRDAGAQWVLAGHSERRHIMGEADALVAQKVLFALEHGLRVMLCIGETLEEREAGKLTEVLERQLGAVFSAAGKLDAASLAGRFAVAYEPVWAIGTGKVAGTAEVAEAHAVVRRLLESFAGESRIPVLYGGSVKPANAGAIVHLDNVDGLLVGGASLDPQSFLQIVSA